MLTRGRAAGVVLVALAWCWLPIAARAASPWAVAITATDPTTHEVGATGAECAPEDAASMATILPGHGAAVALPTDATTSDRFLAALAHQSAPDTLATAKHHTSGLEGRVLAVATLSDVGATWVGGSVLGGGEWVGPGAAEVTVGVSPSVLAQGAHALGRHAPLPERLLSALEATAAGRACNGRPSSAFIIVSEPGQLAVVPARGLSAARTRQRNVLKDVSGQLAADELEDELLRAGSIPHPTGPHAPTLYVSLLASPQGFGAVTLLRQAYEQINAASATPSASAVEPTATAAAAVSTPAHVRSADDAGRVLVIALLVLGGVAAILGISRRLRHLDEDQNGSPAS
jgi:hypothetical protein